jgi:hypothetical protein
MVLGCGPGHHQAATLQQLVRSVSGMDTVSGVLFVMDCVAGDAGAEHQVRALEQWCRDAGFARTRIMPLAAPLCAVLAHH